MLVIAGYGLEARRLLNGQNSQSKIGLLRVCTHRKFQVKTGKYFIVLAFHPHWTDVEGALKLKKLVNGCRE